ncbi:MAG: FAD-dependent oxidoreductase [Sandaracinaceae bacterium]
MRRVDLSAPDVAVIGCGTAGAAAALYLARAGHRVTVYEAVAHPSAVGAGIMLQPTGLSVLDELGLFDVIARRGHRVHTLDCRTRGGRRVIDLAYADVDEDAYGLGLHRGVLFAALFEAVKNEPEVQLRCGVPVDAFERAPRRTGKFIVDTDGARHGPHDLVVVADGARSDLRDDTAITAHATEYGWGALWFIGDDTERAFDGVLAQTVHGTEQLVGLLPCGLGPDGDTPQVSLFWSLRRDRLEAHRQRGLDAWKDEVRGLDPRSEALLAQIHDPDQVLYARYFDVELSPWHTRDVVYLGDAAHATSPQLGQGANLALMDARALRDALTDMPTLAAGLARYSDQRRAHLAYYQWATRMLTPFFQSDHAVLGWARDLFMGPACRLPYVRRRMVQTMCGVERGILGTAPMPMPNVPPCPPSAVADSGA